MIINFPGSKKAVCECFEAIQPVLIHAIQLIRDEKAKTVLTHQKIQSDFQSPAPNSVHKPSIETSTNYAESMMSEASELTDLLDQSSSSMDEIVLNDDIMKIPLRASNGSKTPSEKSSSSGFLSNSFSESASSRHVCPHKTAVAGDADDRNSPFPMIKVDDALRIVFDNVKRLSNATDVISPINCPPFRASIKDGYAIKSKCLDKQRTVVGYIPAGDPVVQDDFADNECFKINTGAAVPKFADAIVQVEDTKLIEQKNDGSELKIELLQIPKANCDIREIGSDMKSGEVVFRTNGMLGVPEKSIAASVGLQVNQKLPRIAVISTGDELVDPQSGELREGQIYDSNSTMLKLLVEKFGFAVKFMNIAKDDQDSLKRSVEQAMETCDVIISSGGVSMGDKDFVKPLMNELGFKIHFGRVNMKPGKPMTFATKENISYFALPGNPVSAFVTFHLFVLPSLRYMSGFSEDKSKLPLITVILQKDKYVLDQRPEYARATVSYSTSKGLYYAQMSDNQMSSRLASLINADVLLHLPGETEKLKLVNKGFKVPATILDHHFVSCYQP